VPTNRRQVVRAPWHGRLSLSPFDGYRGLASLPVTGGMLFHREAELLLHAEGVVP